MPSRSRSRAALGRAVGAYLARTVPISRAMGIRLRSFDDSGVTLTAPLAPNVNDKGIAFGGSLASILALSGWALTELVLREACLEADVLIASSTTAYVAPVAARIVARCPLPERDALDAFVAAYRRRGKARLRLAATVETAAGPAVRFAGVYVARRKRGAAPARQAGATRPPAGPARGSRCAARTRRRSGRSRSAPSARR